MVTCPDCCRTVIKLSNGTKMVFLVIVTAAADLLSLRVEASSNAVTPIAFLKDKTVLDDRLLFLI